MYAKWTCRHQFATKIKEEEEKSKQAHNEGGGSSLGGGSNLETASSGCVLRAGQNYPTPKGGGGGVISCEGTQQSRRPNKLGLFAESRVHLMAIGEW